MKLLQVPVPIVDQVWPAVAPHLAKAIEHSRGMQSLASVHARVKANEAQLWVIAEDAKPHRICAAGITSITQYPTGKRAALIELLSGKELGEWIDLKGDIEAWAAQNGCEAVFCWARKGWARHLPDFRLTHYVLEKELRANV